MTEFSGILWSPYWISGHVNVECILSAQVNRSHSWTWNYTQRSTSSAQWCQSCSCLSFWTFLWWPQRISWQEFFGWNTSLLMTEFSGILWSPYWISGHVNVECILSAQVNRSHSWTWNYTQRSTSSAQWCQSCSCLSFWTFLVVATTDFVARIFWLEYQFINDRIFGDSMVAILDFRSCECWVHFKCTSE